MGSFKKIFKKVVDPIGVFDKDKSVKDKITGVTDPIGVFNKDVSAKQKVQNTFNPFGQKGSVANNLLLGNQVAQEYFSKAKIAKAEEVTNDAQAFANWQEQQRIKLGLSQAQYKQSQDWLSNQYATKMPNWDFNSQLGVPMPSGISYHKD